MKIVNFNHEFADGGREGRLTATLDNITKTLGFGPNRYSELEGDGKVTLEWIFELDGSRCAIWDYKGARWSCSGDHDKLAKLFGGQYQRER